MGCTAAPSDWSARARTLLDTYGSRASVPELLETMLHRLTHLAGHADARAGSTGRADLAEHARMYRQDREHIAALI